MTTKLVPEPSFISRQVTQARRFYFGMDGVPAGELAVVCGGWERVAADYMIDRSTFPWLGMEFVAGGRGRLHMGRETRILERGALFAYGPGVRHRIETDPEAVFSKYYLNFTGREAADLLASVMLAPGSFRMMSDAGELEEAWDALIKDGEKSRPQAPAIAALQFRTLILRMSGEDRMREDADQRARQTLRRCLAYIDQGFLETRMVEQVAAACGVSPSHLTRLFIRFGYGPPHRYLTRKKMLHAATLLDSGVLLVGEVAERLGLDPFQFSRVFKRVHGVSPSTFVKRHGRQSGV